jgi:hypothetical protein
MHDGQCIYVHVSLVVWVKYSVPCTILIILLSLSLSLSSSSLSLSSSESSRVCHSCTSLKVKLKEQKQSLNEENNKLKKELKQSKLKVVDTQRELLRERGARRGMEKKRKECGVSQHKSINARAYGEEDRGVRRERGGVRAREKGREEGRGRGKDDSRRGVRGDDNEHRYKTEHRNSGKNNDNDNDNDNDGSDIDIGVRINDDVNDDGDMDDQELKMELIQFLQETDSPLSQLPPSEAVISMMMEMMKGEEEK